ncbi:MAG: HD-GYP domain-containing protein, partial [Bacillota bacterium]
VAKLKRLGLLEPNAYEFRESNGKQADYAPQSEPGHDLEYHSRNDTENDFGNDFKNGFVNVFGYGSGNYSGGNSGYDPEQNYIQARKEEAIRIVDALKVKMNIHGDRVLELPNKVLNKILFDSKTEPWWIYVNALSNYVSWIYSHSIDVAIISLVIAKELGYGEKDLWNIGLGAFFHDVGELLVPRDILERPKGLDAWEMAYLRQHCELGMVSLEPFCLAKECTDIVIQHHERLDGSGYPRGLKGSEISRNARIVIVADAFDAITSRRPYRESKDVDSAIKILREEEGAKYPQDLVSLLEAIMK